MKALRNLLAAVALIAIMLPNTLLAHPAQDLVEQVTQKLLIALDSPEAKSDSEFLRSQINTDVLPHIDFESMTKLTVGKAWKSANAEQRTDLVTEFRDFLLNTYTSALNEYSGQTMEFLPYGAGKREERAEVKTLFKDKGASASIPVDYKLHNKNGPWMIYDIRVEQVSLVLGYKSEFSSLISKGGVDGLINALQEKNN